METARGMFTTVQEIRLEIGSAREVVPGSEPSTWVIRSVDARLRVSVDKMPEPYKADSEDQEFVVRRVVEPEPHRQIYCWTDPNAVNRSVLPREGRAGADRASAAPAGAGNRLRPGSSHPSPSPSRHNHAAPRTPLASPCCARTRRVSTRSEKTQALHCRGTSS